MKTIDLRTANRRPQI